MDSDGVRNKGVNMEIRVNVIMPKKQFKASGYIDACAQVMKDKTGPELRALFLKTIFGWSPEKKPGFTRKLRKTVYMVSVRVYTDDNYDIYSLVNKGSPHHPIYPRRAQFLQYKKGYRSATQPGQIQSRRAYRSNPTVRSMGVPDHPGFKAREFDKLIKEEYEPTFVRDMQDAMANAARK